MKQKNKKIFSCFYDNRGFGLIEVAVSIYIITMGLLGLMSLVTQNIQTQYVNKFTIIASELAQEGLELARNIRDDNWKDESIDWKADVFQGNNQKYTIDYRVKNDRNIINKVDTITDQDARLYINPDGFYQHYLSGSAPANAQTTPFYRIIEVTKEQDISLTVKCTIYWTERGKDHTYIAETKLYNWKFPS